MLGSHTAGDVATVITRVVTDRIGGCIPKYYLSDSAPVNKSVVRKYIANGAGDDYWLCCDVHFFQITMREPVMNFFMHG